MVAFSGCLWFTCDMTREQAIEHFGGVGRLAGALGISRQSVWKWGPKPPDGRQFQLEVMTNGALKADRRKRSSSEAG